MPALPRLAAAGAALVLLAACQPEAPKPAATPTPIATDAALASPTDAASNAAVDAEALPAINCSEGRLAKLMNQPENDETHAAVIAAVGHRHVRWVHPGDAVTMDYQPGRLNVIVDEHGMIAATRCG